MSLRLEGGNDKRYFEGNYGMDGWDEILDKVSQGKQNKQYRWVFNMFDA